MYKKTISSGEKETWQELMLRLTGVDYTICPSCGKGHMIRKEKINPRCYSPPNVKIPTVA